MKVRPNLSQLITSKLKHIAKQRTSSNPAPHRVSSHAPLRLRFAFPSCRRAAAVPDAMAAVGRSPEAADGLRRLAPDVQLYLFPASVCRASFLAGRKCAVHSADCD